MVSQPRHFVLGVADVEHRDIQLVVQAFQVRQYLAFALAVQGRQRFIHQQQLGAGEQGAGDADALALAAGQVLRMTLKQVPDTQQFGGLGHVHAPLRAWDTFEAELQIGEHRQVRKQARLLEHIAQGAFMRRHKQPFAAVLPHLVVDLHKTVFGAFQTGDAAQAGGLA